jgi:hypothetical protein
LDPYRRIGNVFELNNLKNIFETLTQTCKRINYIELMIVIVKHSLGANQLPFLKTMTFVFDIFACKQLD